ncbi:dTDP-4-dehydrorhamnose reductase [Priestia megaterium]|uniref:dTDP-4-dehydrorhamnose reductase n=1 Tax=Priestia megaterium TaxID=1404 RepID=UPI000BFE7BC0|nr:dTDP-4-dehydrorhamnose reductase [Priestia megaterium]PGZ80224.1 dTDP-4-dehydrorhamnose reductase [Priestia megaterium]
MNILITGSKGQLGQELVNDLNETCWTVKGLGREELDVTNYEEVEKILLSLQPDIIIHSAAYTQVDQAEADVERAFLVNGEGTKNIAKLASQIGAKMCYISTDYVFDGEKEGAYSINDTKNPQTVYGKSKLAGEQYIQEYCEKFFIVRTSWVFGLYGPNFVKTMLSLADKRSEIGVVHDQVGSPTYTADLSKFLIQLVQTEKFGIYHASNTGTCSWYELATEVFKQAGKSVNVNPLTTKEFPRPAKRPANSVLSQDKLEEQGFEKLQHWKDAVKDFINKLNKEL